VLHSPAFRATPLDMKAEADLHFLQASIKLIGHGWLTRGICGRAGMADVCRGSTHAHNPWFPIMPDLTAYLQRVSYALREGKLLTCAILAER